ncbi:S16 family serine protease [Paenibacillus sp. YAF4_2]|uniref:S16 family serine protease n=1 Tax=Paenibacillus sp. YAF4_2 TaxID=3233085 RepID=UPI003F9A3C6B
MSGRTRQAFGIVLIAVMLWVIIYAPTPLVIYEPGIAFDTKPLVQLGSGGEQATQSMEAGERGAFLLTTIKLTDAKYWQVIEAAWKKDFAVYSKDSVMKGKSEKDYLDQMTLDMLASQNSAIEAAYIYAGIPYTTSTELVIDGIEGVSNDFQIGDRIIQVEGQKVSSVEGLQFAIKESNERDLVSLVIQRNEKVIPVKIPFRQIEANVSVALMGSVPGGIILGDLHEVHPTEPSNQITIKAEDIGGPSAGLMFTLQSLNLLLDKDLTEGLRIAGTGTISADGRVGGIGGITYKIVAAHQAGAQLFLAPEVNFAEVTAKVKELHSEMKVVPVTSLENAITAIQDAATSYFK